METKENKSTDTENNVNKYAVIDTLSAFRQLDKIRKNKYNLRSLIYSIIKKILVTTHKIPFNWCIVPS